MAKNQQQIEFNLGINTKANLEGINQVKRMLAEVKTEASDIFNSGGFSVSQVNEITVAANKLENALIAAYNPKINTMNVKKFNQVLKQSGTSLTDIQSKLSMVGVDGQQAFLKATSQLMHMNNTLVKTDGFLNRMAKSFGNVIRYQAFNAVLNKITSSISQANGYIKSLDASLNDIQIVTEKSSDSMKQFAKEANNAAKALGATTTDYTDASLIYYQQGLSDEEVKSRTDTTMKMANVLGATASDVSDYMTAIWNNFYDGSESLEYYGDVITKLGAETAASAEEIATGLGKFSAVADTVGLSYEYATASLATVVAATRQSADSVGTSFKTIFARLEGLKLGETLEDGTSLNKYSQALETVGVSIKDSNGELRAMDEILYDLGARWKEISKDQQVALAQTVAGTRQYNQLVALMDNWDDVLVNVEKASSATGSLEKKNAIYLDSLEAHLNTAKAEWEDFYDSMISEDLLKNLTDIGGGLAKVLTTISDSIGGLIPILTALGSTGLMVFNNQLSAGIAGLITKIQEGKEVTRTFEENLRMIQSSFAGQNTWVNQANSSSTGAMGDAIQTMVGHYSELAQYSRFMTEEDKKQVDAIIKEDEIIGKQKIELEEELSNWQKIANETKVISNNIQTLKEGNVAEKFSTAAGNLDLNVDSGDIGYMSDYDFDELEQQVKTAVNNAGGDATQFANEWEQAIAEPREAFLNAEQDVQAYSEKIKNVEQDIRALKIAEQELKDFKLPIAQLHAGQAEQGLNQAKEAYSRAQIEVAAIQKSFGSKGIQTQNDRTILSQAIQKRTIAMQNLQQATIKYQKADNELQVTEGRLIDVQDVLKDNQDKLTTLQDAKVQVDERARNAEDNLSESAKNLSSRLVDVAMHTNEVVENERKLESQNENVKRSFDSMKKKMEMTQTISNIVGVVGSLGQLATAINSISNIRNIINNDNLSTGQKVMQTIVSLGMSIPMIINSVKKLNETLGISETLFKNFEAFSLLSKKNAADLEKEAIARKLSTAQKKLDSAETKKGNLLKRQEILQNKLNSKSLSKLSKAIAAKKLIKIQDNIATQEAVISNEELVIANTQVTTSEVAETKATIALTTALSALAVIAVAAAAAFTVMYVASQDGIKANIEAQQESAERQRKIADEQKEQAEEQKEQIEQLIASYEELNEQYGSANIQRLREETYKLLVSYGDEANAVRALTASYDELNTMMNNIQSNSISDTMKANIQDLDSINNQIKGQAAASSRKNNTFAEWINAVGGNLNPAYFWSGNGVSSEKVLAETSDQLYISTGASTDGMESIFLKRLNATGMFGDTFGQDYNFDNFTKDYGANGTGVNIDSQAIIDNWSTIQDIMNSSTGISGNIIYTKINAYLSDISDAVEAGIAVKKDLDGLKEEYIVNNSNANNIKTYEEYKNTIDKMAQSAYQDNNSDGIDTNMFFGADAKRKAYQWAAETLSGVDIAYDEWAIRYKDSNIIKYFFEDGNSEEFEGFLDNLTVLELEFLKKHTAFIQKIKNSNPNYSSEEIINATLESFKDIIDYDQKIYNKDLGYNVLVTTAEDKSFDDIDYSALYGENTNFENIIGYSQEQFELLDYGEQQISMVTYYRTEQEELAKTRQAGIETYDALIAAQKQYLIDNGIEKNTDEKYDAAYLAQLTGYSEAEIINAFTEAGNSEAFKTFKEDVSGYSDYLYQNLSAETEAVFEAIYGSISLAPEGSSEDIIRKYKNTYVSRAFNALEANSEYAYYESLIDSRNALAESEIDVVIQETNIQNAFDGSNEVIDNLQKSYKSLKSAVDEYNEKGHFSLDTIQELVDLDSDYLGCLELSGNQLKINTNYYQELTIAQLEHQKTMAFEQLMNDLDRIAKEGVAEAGLKAAESSIAMAQAESLCSEEAQKALPHLQEYIATLRAGLDDGDYYDSEKAQRAFQAYYNRINLLNKGIEEARNNFDDFTGNSKSSKSKDKDKKEWDDEFDRYYVLKKAISDVEDAMSDLDKLQKHLHGKQLLEALDKQNKLLAEQKKRYEDLVAEQQKEGAELRANLSTFEGMTFAADGNITNYAQVTTEQLNKYNSAVDQYNAGSISEEAFDQIEKEYNAFKKDLTRYEALLKEFQDANNKLDDIYYNELANNLKSWETKIQLELDLTKAERDWASFLKNLDTDVRLRFTDINSNLKLNTFNVEQLGLDKDVLEAAMNETMDEIYKFVEDKNYKSDKFASLSEAQEELKKYKDSWVSTVNEIRNNWTSAYNDYLQGIDDEAEKLQDIVTIYERLSSQIAHISTMNSLLYGENNYAINDNLYTSQANIQLKQMADFRDAANMWNEYYLKAVEEGDEQAAQKFQDNYREAIDNLYATEEAYIQTLLNSYSNRVNQIFADLDKKLSGGTSLDWVSDQWDAEKQAAEGYYDSVERVYELESMESKWESALNKTSSLKAQQKMKALMDEELASLESRTKLNEYDIGLAEKRLAIAEAQAALEDAQNNKNTMKLTRGADGNWSYQYVADEGDIADKQQALLDAQHEAYEYAKENWMQIQETIMNVQKEALEKLKELELAKASATEEEKALIDEQIAYYKDYYENRLATLYGESNKREINLKTETAALTLGLYNADKDNYEKMTVAEKLLIDDLMEHSIIDLTEVYTASEDTLDMIQQDADRVLLTDNDSISALWDSAAANMVRRWYSDPDSVKNIFDIALKDCEVAQNNLDNAIEIGTIAAGEDYRELGEQIDEVTEKTDELADATEDACDRACNAIDSYKWYVDQLKIAYDNLTTGVYDYVESIKEALRQNQELADRSIANYNAIAEAARNAGIAVANSGNGGSYTKTPPKNEERYVVVGKKTVDGKTVLSNIHGFNSTENLTKEKAEEWVQSNAQAVESSQSGDHDLEVIKYSDLEKRRAEVAASNNNNNNNNISISALGSYIAVDNETGEVLYHGDSFSESNGAALRRGMDKATSIASSYLYKKDGKIYARKEAFSGTKQRTSDLLLSLDTGGYTGSWNDGSGKLAMLHSKELVLNADDTKNMLETVSAVRSLSSIGSSITDAVAKSIAGMLSNLGANFAFAGAGSTSNNNVNNFDIIMNVDGGDVQAIQEAILSLPNLASQYLSQNLK